MPGAGWGRYCSLVRLERSLGLRSLVRSLKGQVGLKRSVIMQVSAGLIDEWTNAELFVLGTAIVLATVLMLIAKRLVIGTWRGKF
mgnify:CR=1 FL=1